MFRFISAVAAASLLAGLGAAQTTTAPEDKWDWNAEVNLNGFKLGHSGSSCIAAKTTKDSVSQLLESMNAACSVSNWNELEEITIFSLTCSGEYAANVSGELFIGDDDASLTLAGAVSLGDAGPVTMVMNGKAARNGGACAVPDAEFEAGATREESPALIAETVALETEGDGITADPAEVADLVQSSFDETGSVEMTKVAAEELAGGIDATVAQGLAIEAEIEADAELDNEVSALPAPVLVAEAPIVAPIPVESAS